MNDEDSGELPFPEGLPKSRVYELVVKQVVERLEPGATVYHDAKVQLTLRARDPRCAARAPPLRPVPIVLSNWLNAISQKEQPVKTNKQVNVLAPVEHPFPLRSP